MKILTVLDQPQLESFIRFPFALYKDEPHWIPPLIAAERRLLRADQNPSFEIAEVRLFIAVADDGRVLGRVAGIINRLETQMPGAAHVRFGWLDFVDDVRVSAGLLGAVEAWGRERGAVLLKGPMGFTTLDKVGVLTDGFETLGTASSLYNFPYYRAHLENLGYCKNLEWLEYRIRIPERIPERFEKIVSMSRERYGLRSFVFRNRRALALRLPEIFDLILDSYRDIPNWVPLSEEQKAFYMRQWMDFLQPGCIGCVEDSKGKLIAAGITLPSLGRAMQKAKGKLFPFGFIHLFRALYFNDCADLLLIGVQKDWRNKGVTGLIFHDLMTMYLKRGIVRFRVNPILDFNSPSLQLFSDFVEGQPYRKRQVFVKPLPGSLPPG